MLATHNIITLTTYVFLGRERRRAFLWPSLVKQQQHTTIKPFFNLIMKNKSANMKHAHGIPLLDPFSSPTLLNITT
jgi:hypothetical protein